MYGNAQLNGQYSISTGYVSESFTFSGGNLFSYSYFSCTGGRHGSGTYALTGNNLELLFDGVDSTKQDDVEVTNNPSTGDSAWIAVKVIDNSDSQITLTSIELKDAAGHEKWVGADRNGISTTQIFKSAFPLVVLIHIPFRGDTNVRLEERGDYQILLRKNRSEFYRAVEGGVAMNYQLKKVGGDFIKMRKKGQHADWVNYKKE